MSDRDHSLYTLARGYAAGTLSSAATEAFEARLAADQAARDALVTVVGHLDPAASPAADYRRGVHNRLRPPLWRRLLMPRPYPGHPSLWALAGAAAVLVVVLCWPALSNRTSERLVGAVPSRALEPQPDNGVANVHPADSAPGRPDAAARTERPLDNHVVRGTRTTPALVPPMENP